MRTLDPSAEIAAPSERAASHCRYTDRIRSAWPNASSPWTRSSTTEGRPCPVAAKVRVEIVIQRYADARIVTGELQNLGIFGPLHPDPGDMNGVKAARAKNGRCARSQPMIEENPFHTTVSRSSSTAAAA
jgi:hypothetical protein